MNAPIEPPRMPHEADGIQELDNRLPAWWVWLFWLSIVWGFAYLLHYHVFKMGPDSSEAYRREMAAAEKARTPTAPVEGGETELPLDQVTPALDTARLSRGEGLFLKNCAVCHGGMGQGMIGPNLTDDFWIHGGEFKDLVHIVREGVPAKGMITWRPVLKPSDIIDVCSYVWSIHGRDVSAAIPPPKPVEPDAREFKRPI